MTTAAPERPQTRPSEAENRRIKARAIALHLWRLGLTVEDVRALPYSSRDRSVPTMTRLARAAFAASPRPEAREKDPPDGRASRTWAITEEKLAEIEAMSRRGETVPERDLLGERGLWLATTDQAGETPDREDCAGRTVETEADQRGESRGCAGAGLSHGYTGSEPEPTRGRGIPNGGSASSASLLPDPSLVPSPRAAADGDPFGILGPACSDCGWRRGLHRPGVVGWLPACPGGNR